MFMDWGIILKWQLVMLIDKDICFGDVIWKTNVWWCKWMKVSLDTCLKNKTVTNGCRTNHQNYVLGWYFFLMMLLDYVQLVMSLDATLFFCLGNVVGVEQVWWLSINLKSNKVIVFGQISLFIFPLFLPLWRNPFFMPAGKKSACLCSCWEFLPIPFLEGSFFALLTKDRLSHSGNKNAFLFLRQIMNMETEICFHFVTLWNWQWKQKCVSISFVILCNWQWKWKCVSISCQQQTNCHLFVSSVYWSLIYGACI